MNKLPLQKQAQILHLLVEGNSLRSTSRLAGVSFNTVLKLLPQIGKACEIFHNTTVQGVKSERLQLDEIWSFCYAKDRHVTAEMPKGAGDVWTWTALDADIKLIVSWNVGGRDFVTANDFVADVKSRLANRVQITSDGYKPYLQAVDNAFGEDVDFAMLVKMYGQAEGEGNEKRYSPAQCIGAEKKVISGNPKEKFISTSYNERQNLTMRMSMRRFTRLTNAFSKKLENHCAAVALHFVYYNFCRIHKSLSVTPAMQAGLMKKPMTLEDVARLLDTPNAEPKKRGPYKKKEKAG